MIRPPPRSTLFPSTTLFRSSVYLPLVRGVTPQALAVFDFAEQGMVAGSRETTTVAPQALYLLNDPFVRRRALAPAERALGDRKSTRLKSSHANIPYAVFCLE